MIPTLGTTGTLLSGMTWTCVETWLSPSVLTIGGAGVWPVAGSEANATRATTAANARHLGMFEVLSKRRPASCEPAGATDRNSIARASSQSTIPLNGRHVQERGGAGGVHGSIDHGNLLLAFRPHIGVST